MATATHVFTKKGKTTPLGPIYEGPYPITERIGDSTLKIKVGTSAQGEPRIEMHHWSNCKPAAFTAEPRDAVKINRGRKQNPRKITATTSEHGTTDETARRSLARLAAKRQ